jgi:hypothetical protein
MGLPPAGRGGGGWAGCLTILTVKTYDHTKHLTSARTSADSLDQDGDRWQPPAKAVMNIRVPQECRISSLAKNTLASQRGLSFM